MLWWWGWDSYCENCKTRRTSVAICVYRYEGLKIQARFNVNVSELLQYSTVPPQLLIMSHEICGMDHNVTETKSSHFRYHKMLGSANMFMVATQIFSFHICAAKNMQHSWWRWWEWWEEWWECWECLCDDVCCAWLGLSWRELGFGGGSMLCPQMFNQHHALATNFQTLGWFEICW